jgi:putative Holliday junction resolvase
MDEAPLNPLRKYLAIDFGERRVGLAVADSEFGIPFPRPAIDCKAQDLWQELQRVVQVERPTDLVLGLPEHPQGHANGKDGTVRRFAEDLRGHFPQLPVHLQNEAFSTQDALAATNHFSKKQKRDKSNKGKIDSAAAAIILKRFLGGEE